MLRISTQWISATQKWIYQNKQKEQNRATSVAKLLTHSTFLQYYEKVDFSNPGNGADWTVAKKVKAPKAKAEMKPKAAKPQKTPAKKVRKNYTINLDKDEEEREMEASMQGILKGGLD